MDRAQPTSATGATREREAQLPLLFVRFVLQPARLLGALARGLNRLPAAAPPPHGRPPRSGPLETGLVKATKRVRML